MRFAISYFGVCKKMSRLSRKVREQMGRCYYCREKIDLLSATEDHRLPKSRGGSDVWQNVVAACWTCNTQKGPMTAEEYRDYRRKLRLDYSQALEGCFFLLERLVNLSTANPLHRLLRGLLLEKIELLEAGIPETDRNVEFISSHIDRLSTELNLDAVRPASELNARSAHA
jgi:hypothetical protein